MDGLLVGPPGFRKVGLSDALTVFIWLDSLKALRYSVWIGFSEDIWFSVWFEL